MNVEIGTQFLFWEYLFKILGVVFCSALKHRKEKTEKPVLFIKKPRNKEKARQKP
jgi:hypothetical protein